MKKYKKGFCQLFCGCGQRKVNGKCLECRKKYRAKWAEKHPREFQESKKWRKKNSARHKKWRKEYTYKRYHLNAKIVFFLESLNDRKCICGQTFSSERHSKPCIDHDHNCCPKKSQSCGKCVRGVLCTRCNWVLGLLNDDINLLPTYLIEYLKRYEWRKKEEDLQLKVFKPEEAAKILTAVQDFRKDTDCEKFLSNLEKIMLAKMAANSEAERLLGLTGKT